jgi:hypothetical protein
METLTTTISAYITTSIPGFNKLNGHLINALISGFLGFTTFFVIILLMHILKLILGYNEKFGLDFLDYLLAGLGSFLQMTGSLVKSYNK